MTVAYCTFRKQMPAKIHSLKYSEFLVSIGILTFGQSL